MAHGGLIALVFMLRSQGVGVEQEQIRHQFPGRPIGVAEMIRCAKSLGLKARSVTTNWVRLEHTPLPAIAALRDGPHLHTGGEQPLQRLAARVDGHVEDVVHHAGRGDEVGLRLVADDQDWSWGAGPELAGPSEALAMAVGGRSVALDDLAGEGVDVLRGRLGGRG